jgi:hypothetical protein
LMVMDAWSLARFKSCEVDDESLVAFVVAVDAIVADLLVNLGV